MERDTVSSPDPAGRGCYLDHAAATPVAPEVTALHAERCARWFANPHSTSAAGAACRRQVERSARQVLACLGISESEAEAIWTSGGTESLNLAIRGAVGAAAAASLPAVEATAHYAVLEAARAAAPQGAEPMVISVDSDGQAVLPKALPPAVSVVAAGHVNNETGAIQDLVRLRREVDARSGGAVRLCVDALQSAGKLDIPWREARIDLLAVGGRKIGGPPCVGILIRRRGVELTPVLVGGGQQGGVRPGTVDTVGAIEFADALQRVCELRKSAGPRILALNRLLRKALMDLGQRFPCRILSPPAASPYILAFAFRGYEGAILMRLLADHGVIVGTGSACRAESGRVSHVLRAMGVDEQWARGMLRVSFGPGNTESDIQTLVSVLTTVVRDY